MGVRDEVHCINMPSNMETWGVGVRVVMARENERVLQAQGPHGQHPNMGRREVSGADCKGEPPYLASTGNSWASSHSLHT